MSIFGSIKDAIFGKKKAPEPATAAPAAPASAPPQHMPHPQTTSLEPKDPAAVPGAPAHQPAATSRVNVASILDTRAAAAGQSLDWRRSIVDLMKLLGLDSSLENRRELARELGYPGDMGDSAAMNLWLHRQVMRELAENGGIVPQELRD